MKSIKAILSLFILTAVFSSNAFAQLEDNATVNASATIVSDLTVTKVADLEFGNILSSETPAIAAGTEGAGSVSVSGATNGHTMDVSILFPENLTSGTDPEVLEFGTHSAAYTLGNDNDPTNADPLDSPGGSGQTLTGTFDSDGTTAHIFVGGAITANNGVAGKTYTGDIVVTVSYN